MDPNPLPIGRPKVLTSRAEKQSNRRLYRCRILGAAGEVRRHKNKNVQARQSVCRKWAGGWPLHGRTKRNHSWA